MRDLLAKVSAGVILGALIAFSSILAVAIPVMTIHFAVRFLLP